MHWINPRQIINTAADMTTSDINEILLAYTAGKGAWGSVVVKALRY
jgi:hypothetical protein